MESGTGGVSSSGSSGSSIFMGTRCADALLILSIRKVMSRWMRVSGSQQTRCACLQGANRVGINMELKLGYGRE